MTVPPRPTHSPFATDNASQRAGHQQAGNAWANGTPPGQRQGKPNMAKQPPKQNRAADTNDLIARLSAESGHTAGGHQNGHQPTAVASGIPGSDFATDEDIRAWCEAVRRTARTEATERAMDADVLESVLRTIPDSTGSRQGSRARARRVSRWAKKIAAADKAKQKYAATLYATFVREYETELAKVSAGRTKPRPRSFQFGR